MSIVIDEWRGCYGKAWGASILPEATGHPAKFSRALIERIYQHVIEQRWVQPGSKIIDPFGGVGLGALDATTRGLNWVGVELEAKWHELGAMEYDCPGFDVGFWRRYQGRADFIGLLREFFALCPQCETALMPETKVHKRTGKVQARRIPARDPHCYRGNLPLWAYKHRGLPGQGRAVLLQGDSRHLRDVLREACAGVDLCCSSPPYAYSLQSQDIDFENERQLKRGRNIKGYGHLGSLSEYGATPGQLAALPPGDLQAALSLSSPPFRQTSGGVNVTQESGALADPALMARHAAGNAAAHGYGEADGNIANLPEGELSIAISSPPFVKSLLTIDEKFMAQVERDKRNGSRLQPGLGTYGDSPAQLARLPEGKAPAPDGAALAVSSPPYEENDQRGGHTQVALEKKVATYGYGETPGNIGNDSGETFWSASALIAAETFAALTPGAHACWVLKAFVRDGALVDFPAQWRALTESVGFVTLHKHHALLVEEHGEQMALDNGNGRKRGKARRSFFRTLQVTRDKARAFWPELPEQEQAHWLAQAHTEKWAQYEKAQTGRYARRKPPTEKAILAHAQKLAYLAHRQPEIAIETDIQYEVVLCQVKPL